MAEFISNSAINQMHARHRDDDYRRQPNRLDAEKLDWTRELFAAAVGQILRLWSLLEIAKRIALILREKGCQFLLTSAGA